jgi:ribonuclease VapC
LIVVDTSALASIFLREPGFERFMGRLTQSSAAFIPVPCYIEFNMLRSLGRNGRDWIDRLLEDQAITLVALETEHARIAADAATKYGKGSGHAARLNFGDCMTYAVAKHRELPLLFAGRDFHLTDIPSALQSE